MSIPPKALRRQAPAVRRRPSGGHVRSYSARRRPRRISGRISWRIRIPLILCALGLLGMAWGAIARALAPTGNTKADRFDAIIVLGAYVNRDGNPPPLMLARVTEAVREYERGVAPRLIVTGHADQGFSEAAMMARIAESQGVPASSIVLEPYARDTIQNACFSVRIMQQQGWHSAEVVTSPSHLPRAGTIFSGTPIQWRAHAAPPITPQSAFRIRAASVNEDVHMLYYLAFSRWAESCSP